MECDFSNVIFYITIELKSAVSSMRNTKCIYVIRKYNN